MAPIGIITGSGTHALPGFEEAAPRTADTAWGRVRATHGSFAGVEVVHISRHGEGHVRLSNHVPFRANVWALRHAFGCRAAIGLTACGAVDPALPLGSLVVFDDLHFLANRLPDGAVCTFHDEPGHRERGHWIYEAPFSAELRTALLEGACAAGSAARDGGCYGHVDGPRFNTRTEIATLAGCGVVAVSQTGGPETVLCGEAELPYALMGFATDYANGVAAEATPVEELIRLMGESTGAFAAVLREALPRIPEDVPPVGIVYRFAA